MSAYLLKVKVLPPDFLLQTGIDMILPPDDELGSEIAHEAKGSGLNDRQRGSTHHNAECDSCNRVGEILVSSQFYSVFIVKPLRQFLGPAITAPSAQIGTIAQIA